MKKSIAILLSVLAVLTLGAQQGSVRHAGESLLEPLQKRDSVLIADQLFYGFELEGVEDGTVLSFPELGKELMDSVEVVKGWRVDTLKGPKGPRKRIRAGIVIAAFDEGRYQLPALSVLCTPPTGTTDTLVFDPQLLDVRTMPVDTATFVIHDLKGQIRYPVTFKELLPWIGGALLLAAITALVVILLKRRRRAVEEAARKDPAYIVALRRLDHFRGNKYWAPEKQKAFYSGITDTLRFYIADRFGIDAMEMTTAEIFDALKGDEDLPEDLYRESKELFEVADFVKFAKHIVSDEDNAKALPSAVRFITSTYRREEEEKDVEEV